MSEISRILRGGGWYSNAQRARSAYRDYDAPGPRDGNVGFRIVRTTNPRHSYYFTFFGFKILISR